MRQKQIEGDIQNSNPIQNYKFSHFLALHSVCAFYKHDNMCIQCIHCLVCLHYKAVRSIECYQTLGLHTWSWKCLPLTRFLRSLFSSVNLSHLCRRSVNSNRSASVSADSTPAPPRWVLMKLWMWLRWNKDSKEITTDQYYIWQKI